MTRPRLWALFPAAFLTALAEGVATVGWVFYARDQLGAAGTQVGWLTGLFTLVYTIFVTVLSRYYRRVRDPRFLLLPAALGMSLVSLVPAAGPGYGMLLGSTALYGALLAAVWPLAISWVSQDAEGEALSRRVGWFSVAWAPGIFAGPLVAGWSYERAVNAPFVLAAALLVAAAGVFALAPGRRGVSSRATAAESAAGGEHGGGDQPRLDRGIDVGRLRLLAWISAIAVFTTGGAVRALLPLWGIDDLALGQSEVGSLLLVRPAVMALLLPLLGQLRFWQFKRWPLGSAALAAATAVVLVPRIGPLAGVVAMLVITGAAAAMVAQSSLFHAISGAAGEQRAGRAALMESAIAGGLIVGSVGTGVLYDAGGAGLATTVVAVAVAAAALVVFLWRPRSKLGRGGHRVQEYQDAP